MERKPMTKQRSTYRNLELDDPVTVRKIRAGLAQVGATHIDILQRNVGDGILRVIVDEEPMGWHLSISHAKRGKKGQLSPGRYPKWDEIAHARYELLPADIDVVMHLPREEDYVALHDTTFHLHEYPDREFDPQLPPAMAGPTRTPSGLILPG